MGSRTAGTGESPVGSKVGKAVLALAIFAALAAITASVGRAAVDPSNCPGGSTLVPAGTPLVIQYGVNGKTRGKLNAYLKAQTTTITVDGARATRHQ